MTKYTGVFGATFDPPTFGHQDVIRQSMSICDNLILVPCIRHPFLKNPLSFNERVEMCRIFSESLPEKSRMTDIFVSDIEKELLKKKPTSPVYTYEVMDALEAGFSNDFVKKNLCFIRGPDNASPDVWRKFYRYQEIERRWHIFTAKQRTQARSTRAREILCKDISYKEKEKRLSGIVPEKILEYIFEHNLYSGNNEKSGKNRR